VDGRTALPHWLISTMLRSFPEGRTIMAGVTLRGSPVGIACNFPPKGAFAAPFKRVGTILKDVSKDFAGKRIW
jgi:hypothetical protein